MFQNLAQVLVPVAYPDKLLLNYTNIASGEKITVDFTICYQALYDVDTKIYTTPVKALGFAYIKRGGKPIYPFPAAKFIIP